MGSKKQIGIYWTLFFCMFLSPLLGTIAVILSPNRLSQLPNVSKVKQGWGIFFLGIGLFGVIVYASQWDKFSVNFGPAGKYNHFSTFIGFTGLGTYLLLRGLGHSFNSRQNSFSLIRLFKSFTQYFQDEPIVSNASFNTSTNARQHASSENSNFSSQTKVPKGDPDFSQKKTATLKKTTAEYATSIGTIEVLQSDYNKLSIGDIAKQNGSQAPDGWLIISGQNLALEIHGGRIVQIVKSVST